MKLKRIICTTDFSDYSNHTIPYGIALAKEFNAKLYICHVVDLSFTSTSGYGEAALALEELKEQMTNYARDQIVQLMDKSSVEWESLITEGNTAEEITRLASEKEADIVISATHGRSGVKKFVLGSVIARLIRALNCPLLVVRSPEREFVTELNQKISLNKILVGCDFSLDSLLALQNGFDLAEKFHSVLHLVHVIEEPIYNQMLHSTLQSEENSPQEIKSQLLQKLMGLATTHSITSCTVRPELLVGEPYEELTKHAVLHDVDLIVLGIRGRDLVGSLLAGSTTDRVMRQAPCPVLLVYSKVQKK